MRTRQREFFRQLVAGTQNHQRWTQGQTDSRLKQLLHWAEWQPQARLSLRRYPLIRWALLALKEELELETSLC